MRDYLNDYPIDIYGREMYEKELDNRIKAGFQKLTTNGARNVRVI